MSVKPASLLLFAGVFVTGLAGGAYFALRGQDGGTAAIVPAGPGPDAVVASPAVLAPPQPPGEGVPAATPAPGTVQESEGVIAEEPERASAPAEPRPLASARNAERRTSSAPRPDRGARRETSSNVTRPREAARTDASAPTRPEAVESAPASRADTTASSTPAPTEAPASVEPSLPLASLPVEPPPVVEPPARVLEELVVSADSVIGLQIETPVTSERARVEDRVEARVTRDVSVGSQVAIPAGSRMLGSITLVEKGGKVKDRARLGIRFHTLVLADGSRLPVKTDTVFREGESPAAESAAKIGGAAVGGAILGAIFGGTKGAIMGGAAGAAGGTAATMSGDRNAATLPAGATLTVRLSAPVTVTVEK